MDWNTAANASIAQSIANDSVKAAPTSRVLSAHAAHVTLAHFGGSTSVYDENTGQKIGQIDLIHGFAHYFGVGVHAGVTAVVAGTIERGAIDEVIAALAVGLRNGRDDRR